MSKTNFDFRDFFSVVVKHIWLVIVITALTSAGTYFLRPRATVTHSATAQFMVSPQRQYDISNNTLQDLVKTQAVLGAAIKDYNKDVTRSADKASYKDLAAADSTLIVRVTGNSRIVTVSVDEASVTDVKTLANLIVEHAVKVSNLTLPAWKSEVITKAFITTQDSKGFSGKKALLLGGAVGLIIGLEGAILYDKFFYNKKNGKAKAERHN